MFGDVCLVGLLLLYFLDYCGELCLPRRYDANVLHILERPLLPIQLLNLCLEVSNASPLIVKVTFQSFCIASVGHVPGAPFSLEYLQFAMQRDYIDADIQQ